uniref:ATP synthase F0 subunit 8 n=1 Tax=Saphonecrus sp. ZJUH 20220015 TaxID=2943460 RepID=A0A9E8G7M3_9HYME|nr:ATP synthase F0 subunit 8 [Saphonecrus sp. ZJUH 20220015]
MPQMKPLNWLNLMTYFLLLMLMMMTNLNFLLKKKKKKKLINYNIYNKSNLKW